MVAVTSSSAVHASLRESGLEYHIPITCSIRIDNTSSYCNFSKKRVPPYDILKVVVESFDSEFRDCLSQPPIVPPEVEPASHLHILDQFVFDSAKLAFPKSKHLLSRVGMTPMTHEAILSQSFLLR